MNSDNLKYVLRQFVERPLPECRPRSIFLPSGTGKVIGLTGVRRSGKTFLFFDTIRRLSAEGIKRRRLVYLNFEDDRLQPLHAEDLDLILRCLRELFPETTRDRIYLFLDEIQSAPGWERWVRRIKDTEDVEVFVTGSSSRVLKRDLASAMRGRSITYEIFPLSFCEYLQFIGIEIQPSSADNESIVRHALENYLTWGGFPEIVLSDEAVRPLILSEYASVMFYRDIIEGYGVRNEKLMRELLRYCYRNTATMVNVSKLHRDFKSLGFSVSKNTLFDYLSFLEDSFLIFLLPKKEESLRKQAHNPRKLHVIDPGLVAAFHANPERDIGRKLETVVFLEMRRQRQDWHYYVNSSEVDLCDSDGTLFIDTCWSLTDPDTIRREAASMEFARSKWPRANGMILYHEYKHGIQRDIPGAEPAWRFLLSSGSVGKKRPSKK